MTCGERCAKPSGMASHGQIQAGVVELVVKPCRVTTIPLNWEVTSPPWARNANGGPVR